MTLRLAAIGVDRKEFFWRTTSESFKYCQLLLCLSFNFLSNQKYFKIISFLYDIIANLLQMWCYPIPFDTSSWVHSISHAKFSTGYWQPCPNDTVVSCFFQKVANCQYLSKMVCRLLTLNITGSEVFSTGFSIACDPQAGSYGTGRGERERHYWKQALGGRTGKNR